MLKQHDGRAQIALEFLIIYSFVLIVFILIFSVITLQRAATLSQQQYSLLQLQSQNIASYIDQAVQAGTGYIATVPLVSGVARNSYSLNISSTGVIIARTTTGRQSIVAYGFSHAKSLVINGTINRTASANGISIYSIPSYTGFIRISNLRGTIYIDQSPPSISSLAEGAIVTPQANVRAAIFNSLAYNYIAVSNSPILGNSFSIYLWFNANGCGTLVGKRNSNTGFSINVVSAASPCVSNYNTNDMLDFNYMNSGIPNSLTTNTFPAASWMNAVATFDSTNGILTWYVNGNKAVSYTGLGAITQSNSMYIGYGDSVFNGSIANLQIYNSILSPSQVTTLYINGIGSMPVNSSVVGWWPLNGNANDYSGFGNGGGAVNSIKYGSVIQLNTKVYSFSGGFLPNSLVGFVTSEGTMSGNGMYSSVYSNSSGLASGFVSSYPALGSGNVTSDVFNGNLSTTQNLVGWWPMDTCYLNRLFDLSRGRNTGLFNNILCTQYVNQTSFFASNYSAPLSCNGASGPHKISISIPQTNITQSIVSNNTFTVVAWVNWLGPNNLPGNEKSVGIFGGLDNGAGFQFDMYCGTSLLQVGSSYIPNSCGPTYLPSNGWEMVAAEYNGNTGAAEIYNNSTVFESATLPQNLDLDELSQPYQISNDTTDSSHLSGFNGQITNLQLYDSYLSQQQIDSLYQSGLTSLPLQNSGLLGWWPLLNNTIDYSNNGNNGTAQNCISGITKIGYVVSAYNNTQQPIGPGYATFNGNSNAVIPLSGGFFQNSLLSTAKNNFAVSFWFANFNSVSSFDFNEALINVENPSGASDNTLNISICGMRGICGNIGTGSAWLNNSVNYNFGLTKNTWYSITEVFSPTTWTIYLNGNKANSGGYGSGSGEPALITAGSSIYLGSGPGLRPFTGQMADLQVYNSTLMPQQVMQLYVQGLPAQYRNNISIG